MLKKESFVSHTCGSNAMQNDFFFFFFLENEQCEMWEFFSYCVFGPHKISVQKPENLLWKVIHNLLPLPPHFSMLGVVTGTEPDFSN